VFLVGTAHVYVETAFSAEQVLAVLGPTWKANDILKLN
jgi:hypothetical protein